MVMSWINIPGDNAQRQEVFAAWKETLRADFKYMARLKPPHLVHNPRIHIEAYVGSASDPINRYSRYKTVIDYLQAETSYFTGDKQRFRGCLGYIDNDRNLQPEHIAFTERVTRTADKAGYMQRKVVVYIWEGS
jgi:hypothetical protein